MPHGTRTHRLFSAVAVLALVVAGMCGCDVSRWDPGAPEVIEVSSYDLVTEAAQGSASHRVEEVWIYSATDVLGVYPLPA
ncbi:MAG: hypothetical protein L7S02_02135, partial [Flavobacteriales bacterium]|nr:hypothetical protein [Flavobacteriales bacterium]